MYSTSETISSEEPRKSLQNSMSVLPARLPCTTSPIRKSFAHPSQTSAILVNGTSVGMAPKPRTPSSPTQRCSHKDLFVFDVIYNPQETRLLREAKRLDARPETVCTCCYTRELLPSNCGLARICRLRSSKRNTSPENKISRNFKGFCPGFSSAGRSLFYHPEVWVNGPLSVLRRGCAVYSL